MTDPAGSPHEQIRNTIARYCQLCDDGRFDEWAELFEPDATFFVMGSANVGRPAIQAFIEKGQPPERRGRHVTTSTVIELDDERTSARTWTDFMFVGSQNAVTTVGRYHDLLRAGDDGRWRFALREIVFQGDEPQRSQPLPG